MQATDSLTQKRFRPIDKLLKLLICLAAVLCVSILVFMVGYILYQGLPVIDWTFLSTQPSALRGTYGILPNIINTIYIILLTLLIATPLGVGAAIYLCEYANKGKVTQTIEFAMETLAGIPSVIYGLFGFVFFCIALGFNYSILAGSLTLTIMVLPVIVTTTRESILAVPSDYRQGAMALGAGRWYVTRTVVLPNAFPGILTAIILAIGRIVGESAALIFTAGIGTTLMKTSGFSEVLGHASKSGATLTVQLYQYMLRGSNEYAYGIAAVLLVLVFGINLLTRLLVYFFGARAGKKG